MNEITTLDEFKRILRNSKQKSKLIVIDFYADWCEPCKKIAPILNNFAIEYTYADFYKINVDNDDLKSVCEICQIKSVPTICYYYMGKYLTSVSGTNLNQIERYIRSYDLQIDD